MKHHARQASRFIRAGILLAGIAAVLGSAAGSPAGSWRALQAAINNSGSTPDLDQLLANTAAVAAWVGVGWLLIAVVLEVASALPGATGRGCATVAGRISPLLVRKIVQAAIGVSIVAGPLTAGAAFATGPSAGTSTSSSSTTTTSTSTTSTSPTTAPPTTAPPNTAPPTTAPPIQIDRPNSLAAPGIRSSSPAPLALDRPATAFVASAPPTPKWTSTGAAALVTGVAHRDTTDSTAGGDARSYVVRRGDTLWDIAARHLGPGATSVDISRAWPAWYQANRAVIGADPGVIRPGELLSAPSGSTSHASTR